MLLCPISLCIFIWRLLDFCLIGEPLFCGIKCYTFIQGVWLILIVGNILLLFSHAYPKNTEIIIISKAYQLNSFVNNKFILLKWIALLHIPFCYSPVSEGAQAKGLNRRLIWRLDVLALSYKISYIRQTICLNSCYR